MSKRTDDLANQAKERSKAEQRAGGQSVQGNSDAAQPHASSKAPPVTDSERLANQERRDERERREAQEREQREKDANKETALAQGSDAQILTDLSESRPSPTILADTAATGDRDAAHSTHAQSAPATVAPDQAAPV